MPIDTAAKRAAVAHIKRAGKGVTPNAAQPFIWRVAVAWNYGGNTLTPVVVVASGEDRITLGTVDSMLITPNPGLGGRGSW